MLSKLLPIVVWLTLATSLFAGIADRREELAAQSRQYRARHFPKGDKPPKHHWQNPQPMAGANSPPTPGGIGYGFSYDENALLWTNCTTADYYIIAPMDLGSPVSYLYLTSTCRAQMGTEALAAYEGTDEPGFWVYDWSQPNGGQWELMIDLPANPQYLTNLPDQFAINRQMLHVRNGTYLLGFDGEQYSWENRVMLFDFNRGDWDLVYSSDYTTASLQQNTYVSGGGGWWGPIVETFDNTYTNVNPIGFDLVRLFQDGNPNSLWLTPENSSVNISSPWQVLTLAPDTGFTVGVNATNLPITNQLGTLCVNANSPAASFTVNSGAAIVSPYWIITPNSNSWDNTVVGLSPGDFSITFNTSAGQPFAAQQSFAITAGSITTVQPAPVFGQVMLNSNGVQLTFSAFSNSIYQLQYTTNFTPPAWTNLGAPLTATNVLMNALDATQQGPERFYRVELLP